MRSIESAIRAGAFAVMGALAFTACETDTRPIVVTDNSNVIIDMPTGVRWDVVGMTELECDHSGGFYDLTTLTCEGIDF